MIVKLDFYRFDMSFTERFNLLIDELNNQGIKQTQLAEKSGLSRSQVSLMKDGRLKSIGIEPAIKIEKEFGYLHQWLMLGTSPKKSDEKEEITPNERYEAIKFVGFRLRAGVSGFAVDYLDEEEFEPLFFKKTWFERRGYNPNKLFAVVVNGESMLPTLDNGSVVVVNTEVTEPKSGTIFAVNYHGETVVKRLVQDMGKYWLVSDNNSGAYPRVMCDENTFIIGKVVHYQGEL